MSEDDEKRLAEEARRRIALVNPEVLDIPGGDPRHASNIALLAAMSSLLSERTAERDDALRRIDSAMALRDGMYARAKQAESSLAAALKRVSELEVGIREAVSVLDRLAGDTDPPGAPETDWHDDWPMFWSIWRLNAALTAKEGANG